MNIQITHTVTLAPEVLTLLQSFLGKAQPSSAQAPTPKAETPTPAPKAEAKAPAKVEEPKAETPTPTTAKANDITLEQVRDAVQKKALAGKRVEVKAILTSFGAENVTGLEKEKYAEFLEQVNAL